MSDTALMTVIAFFAVFGGVLIASAVYVIRVDQLRRECAERVAQANDEVRTANEMVRRTELQRRLLDEMPVARLIPAVRRVEGDSE